MAATKNTMAKKATDSSVLASLPDERSVRGYPIRRMPIGRYLKAAQTLQDTPVTVLRALFPEGDAEASQRLRTMDKTGLESLFMRALTVLPDTVLALVSELTDVPLDRLTDDPAIGLDGLAEIVSAWLEVNRIENFIAAASALLQKGKALAATAGFNG